MYDDDVAEEIDTLEGEMEGDQEDDSDEELVELPGGLDQLEALMEEHERQRDQASTVFSQHTGSVFSCSLATGTGLVATGGEDDTCFVWRPDTGEVVSKLAGWVDSVTATCWNKDSSMLAAGDMAGTVRVYRDQGSGWAEVWSYELGQDLTWLGWHPLSPGILLAATGEGQLWVWVVPAGHSKVMGGGERVESATILQVTRLAPLSPKSVTGEGRKAGAVWVQRRGGAAVGSQVWGDHSGRTRGSQVTWCSPLSCLLWPALQRRGHLGAGVGPAGRVRQHGRHGGAVARRHGAQCRHAAVRGRRPAGELP